MLRLLFSAKLLNVILLLYGCIYISVSLTTLPNVIFTINILSIYVFCCMQWLILSLLLNWCWLKWAVMMSLKNECKEPQFGYWKCLHNYSQNLVNLLLVITHCTQITQHLWGGDHLKRQCFNYGNDLTLTYMYGLKKFQFMPMA